MNDLEKYATRCLVLTILNGCAGGVVWIISELANHANASFVSFYGVGWLLASMLWFVILVLWIFNFAQWKYARKQLRNSRKEEQQ